MVLITGASSGIGRDMAINLGSKGYDLILVARDKKRLEEVKSKISAKVEIIAMDLRDINNCYRLYDMVKDKNIEILINNAGFGLIGPFNESDISKELDMIDLNIKALHVLTKLFISDFIKKDLGYILNVSSSAAFQPGPLMATYYSTKSYVYNLTLALYEELRRINSNVKISCLCPGPVDTNFNNVAGCEFKIKSLPSDYVANYAIKKMFKGKILIIPGFSIKMIYIFGRLLPNKLKLRLTYNIQHRKIK